MEDSLKKNTDFWQALFQNTEIVQLLRDGEEPVGNEGRFLALNLEPYGKIKVTAKPAVPLGANFMSDVYTVTASITTGQDQYASFVKILPSNPDRVAAAFHSGYYHSEAAAYQEWLPGLRQLKQSKGLKDSDVPLNVAKPYYVNLSLTEDGTSFKETTSFVLEELKSKGYRMNSLVTTTSGIDYDHAKLVIHTYANYHALSIAHLRQMKASDGSYNLSPACQVFRKNPNTFIDIADVYRTVVLPRFGKILRHFKHHEAADWLEGFMHQTGEIWSFSKSSMHAGPLTCITHGDSWSNNILFRYDDCQQTKPSDALLIDWQIARLGHPSVDLCYFLFSSTSSAFRGEHLDQLLIEYFSILKSALFKLDIDLEEEGYDEDRFLQDSKERYILGLFMALFIMPILLDSNKGTNDSENHQQQDDNPRDIQPRNDDEPESAIILDGEDSDSGWELFDMKTIVSNPLLSKRVVELIVDVKAMAS